MANFKLKESAGKLSSGISLAGLNIIPQTGFIMPYAGPTPLTTATGTSGTNTITVASATGAFVGQGVYGTGLSNPGTGLNYITAVSGTTITVAFPLNATISGSSVRFCPVGWLLCDGNNGTVDLRGHFVIGATAAGNISGVVGADNHTHTYAFSGITYAGSTNTHQNPAYYTSLSSAGAVATAHSHVITTSIDTASHYSGNFINWSNGNNTTRTFRSHDHVGNVTHNSGTATEGAHAHNSLSAGTIAFNTGSVVETAHAHNAAASPSGTTPAATTTAGHMLMNYIVKV